MIKFSIKRTLIISLSVFVLASCAAAPAGETGADYFERGLYDQAAEKWIQAAKDGDPVAQHNMGVLSRDGLGTTTQSHDDAAGWFLQSATQSYVPAMVSLAETQIVLGQAVPAASWLTLAARWGNEEAIELLRERELPVPEPDLYSAAIQDQNLEHMRAVGVLVRPPIRKINSKGSGREN